MSGNDKVIQSSSTSTEDARLLPKSFSPTDKDVVCGWARQHQNHVGNKRFRELIDEYAPRYVKASTKMDKSQVIAEVIDKVRNESSEGGFVKKDSYSGRWYEIGNEKARDKVGHAMRKASEESQKETGIKIPGRISSKKAKKEIAKKVSAKQAVIQEPINLHCPQSASILHPGAVTPAAAHHASAGSFVAPSMLHYPVYSDFSGSFNCKNDLLPALSVSRALVHTRNLMTDRQLIVPGAIGVMAPLLSQQSNYEMYLYLNSQGLLGDLHNTGTQS